MICGIDKCCSQVLSRGLCAVHYYALLTVEGQAWIVSIPNLWMNATFKNSVRIIAEAQREDLVAWKRAGH